MSLKINRMELPDDLVWCLRALAQDFETQKKLYPEPVELADELASDFELAFDRFTGENGEIDADLTGLDQLMGSKSGIPEFWIDDAMSTTGFWTEMRNRARRILDRRGYPVAKPGPSANTFIFAPYSAKVH
jgi:hypothetical protein